MRISFLAFGFKLRKFSWDWEVDFRNPVPMEVVDELKPLDLLIIKAFFKD